MEHTSNSCSCVEHAVFLQTNRIGARTGTCVPNNFKMKWKLHHMYSNRQVLPCVRAAQHEVRRATSPTLLYCWDSNLLSFLKASNVTLVHSKTLGIAPTISIGALGAEAYPALQKDCLTGRFKSAKFGLVGIGLLDFKCMEC